MCEVYHEPTQSKTSQKMIEKAPNEKKNDVYPIKSVVVVISEFSPEEIIIGSGTIISSDGHILTNYHVVDLKKSRQVHHYVAINLEHPEQAPDTIYECSLVRFNDRYDLALLKIIDYSACKMLTPLKLGDSNRLNLGDEIVILGFPTAGASTITLTKGSISGWLNDGDIQNGWIKTDAEVGRGNSGGAAVNKYGELIGVPTSVSIEGLGKIGVIRPINIVKRILSID